MPDFKLASDGIGKIFIGEILSLISTILLIVTGVIAVVIISTDGSAALAGVSGILAIASLILYIIALIVSLVGFAKASKQEQSFKTAIVMIIITAALALLAGILESVFPGANWADITNALSNLLFVGVVYCAAKGCGSLLRKAGDPVLAKRGDSLSVIIIVLFVAGLVFYFFHGLLLTAIPVVSVILVVAYAVTEIVAYFMFLSMLSKTKKSLAER